MANIMSCLRRVLAFSICNSSANANSSAGVLHFNSWRFIGCLWGTGATVACRARLEDGCAAEEEAIGLESPPRVGHLRINCDSRGVGPTDEEIVIRNGL